MTSWTRMALSTVLLAVFLVNVVSACEDSSCCSSASCESCRSSCTNSCNIGCATGNNCCSSCRARCCQQCSSTVTVPSSPTPDRIIITPAPSPYVVPESSTSINSTNVNNNNFTVPVEVRIENVISNHNNISVPINITVQTSNQVHIQSESSGVVPSPSPTPPVPVPVPTCQNTTNFVPVRVPYPYPVQYYPRPTTGCCHVVQPCVPQGCQWHTTQCGSSCRSPVMFQPSNPCQTGCQRMDSSYQTWCFGRDHCRKIPVDCSHCPNEFYNDYSTFASCGGCFRQNFGSDLLGRLSWPWAFGGGGSMAQAQPYADQGGFV
ncbi:uncharacterized protein LOC132698257 [Cylas formicarius]|uniref:uncharacterized protein LOC132698257 n=1 Tax=Cylas formicarius TaxID=197179 RepID=UPI002958CBC8|nr:uncharacterized protein LOC132698257 [Cylas formicarius]